MNDMELAEEIERMRREAGGRNQFALWLLTNVDEIIAALRRGPDAQARIAELEEALAIYADSQNFVGGNDWYWVGDDDPTLAAKKALKSRA